MAEQPSREQQRREAEQQRRETEEKREPQKLDADQSTERLEGTESGRRSEKLSTRNTLGVAPVETSASRAAEVELRASQAAQEAYNKVIEKDAKENAASDDTLFEVMVDTWGSGDKVFQRGDLLRAGDSPYDIAHAEKMGTVRRAPEYENVDVAHATMPLTASGSIDVEAQRSARGTSGTETATEKKA